MHQESHKGTMSVRTPCHGQGIPLRRATELLMVLDTPKGLHDMDPPSDFSIH